MSLIPYHPREGREIVLRHRNAIVVRDPSSHRLEIRGMTDCPTCHRPLRSSSPERQYDHQSDLDSYVDPDYFRMLRAGHDQDPTDRPPSSPIRRLVQSFDQDTAPEALHNAEFVSSSPAVHEGSRIRREAFSPNYFKTFFVEERELGRGGKGVVLLVRHEIDGCHLGHFACKRVPVGDDHAWLEKVLIEVELLAKLSHPNLVSYRHVWLEDVKLNRFGPSVACAYILQQYCNGGDLLHYVIGDQPRETTKEDLKAQLRRRSKGHTEKPQDLFTPQRRLPLEEIYSLFKDITSGLAYLHAANYIHRDLKPSNCLLHREGNALTCLISDFGEVQPENAMRKSTGSTGTISYCAPEVLKQDSAGRYGNFTAKSDIFSLGMILYFMCFGRLPYHAANTIQEELEDIDVLRAEITDWKGFQDERRERPDLPSKLYQLLKRLLAISPTERPTASEVLSVMKNESSLDSVARGPRSVSPSLGLPGRRIQNLDSPAQPGTPIQDPKKRATVTSSSQEDITETLFMGSDGPSSHATAQNNLRKLSNTSNPRYRAPAMTASHSHDGYTRSSPEQHPADSGSGVRALSPPIDTPLLMAPPTTLHDEIRQHIVVAYHQILHSLQEHASSLTFSARLSFFLIKMASLSRPCWPYMVNVGIGGLLVALAGFDLGLTDSRGMSSNRTAVQGAGGRHGTTTPRHPGWDWRISVFLLIIHFVALWVSSRSGSLCPKSHDRWGEWRPRL